MKFINHTNESYYHWPWWDPLEKVFQSLLSELEVDQNDVHQFHVLTRAAYLIPVQRMFKGNIKPQFPRNSLHKELEIEITYLHIVSQQHNTKISKKHTKRWPSSIIRTKASFNGRNIDHPFKKRRKINSKQIWRSQCVNYKKEI